MFRSMPREVVPCLALLVGGDLIIPFMVFPLSSYARVPLCFVSLHSVVFSCSGVLCLRPSMLSHLYMLVFPACVMGEPSRDGV